MNRYIPAKQITVVRLLGGGAYGVVYLVRLRQRQLAAAKRLSSSHVTDPQAQQQLVDEIKLHATLEHPNVIALIGASWTTRADLQAVFEYAPRGDLLSYLETQQPPTPWDARKLALALDVALALAYLHAQRPAAVVHRDLKSRNILLSEQRGRLVAKLCDFGSVAGA
ncbi:hypothetical protein P43SY_011934 [Pythium insidiosum]|uniref:Protein kinase domain-containing protein n=1 Tax=Pythium insidiosum TaxID=114742 RepID=A0AAD5LR52_PYTIN|nr:hypothetical protein P43SY_011934 [Pythium insidiosum]